MTNIKISETCQCGATFSIELPEDHVEEALKQSNIFRRCHVCSLRDARTQPPSIYPLNINKDDKPTRKLYTTGYDGDDDDKLPRTLAPGVKNVECVICGVKLNQSREYMAYYKKSHIHDKCRKCDRCDNPKIRGLVYYLGSDQTTHIAHKEHLTEKEKVFGT